MSKFQIRDYDRNTSYEFGAKKFGLTENDLIGWFSNKYNYALGWLIFKASDEDKKEFGNDVKRSYSYVTDTTSIVKFNINTGVYSFLDNNAYENGQIIFEKARKYRSLFIDNNEKSFKEFQLK